jgi:hypothetical protein
MQPDYAQIPQDLQAAPPLAAQLRQQLAPFLAPLLLQLPARMDARLVRTFQATLEAILCFRNRIGRRFAIRRSPALKGNGRSGIQRM